MFLISLSKSFHFVSKSNQYSKANFCKIFCHKVESLHGKIAFLTGWFSSIILSKSTCKVSQIQLQTSQAH